jgi:hypothetical protein
MTPTQFEQATANLLHDLGYKDVRRTGGSGDLNVDVWARDAQGKRVAVQCKQYGLGHSVGSPDVQTFIGMVFQHHGADRGIFATTSGFTAPAAALCKQHNIWMLDGVELSRQIAQLTTNTAAAAKTRGSRVLAVLGLPVGLFLLAYTWQESDRLMPTDPAVPAAVLAFTAPIKSTPPPAAVAVQTRPPSTPMVRAPSTPTVQIVHVANTNGVGVYLRRTPSLEDKLRAYQDGTALRVLGPDADDGGVHWRHVSAPDGLEGYVPSDYVAPAPNP